MPEAGSLSPLGGVIGGEHGIGHKRKAYLRYSLDPAAIDLMKRVKRAMDPNNVLDFGRRTTQLSYSSDARLISHILRPSEKRLTLPCIPRAEKESSRGKLLVRACRH